MSTLLIEGGHRLGGRVAVEGNKNAALPLLAACLLTEEPCTLTNVPRIGDVEVMALQAMGARIVSGDDHFLEAPDGLRPASMYLDEASVTGTETALLAAACAAGTTEIRHAATEPHVVELCEFLAKMGADMTGIGSSKLRIDGVPRLHGAEHRLGGDYIEAGSWAVIAAITGGEIAIDGAREEDMEVVGSVLRRMNVECGMRGGTFEVNPSTPKA